MRYVVAFLLAISVISAEARADSLVHNLTTSTTSPVPANSCIYVDQGPGTDTKLCSNWVPTLLGGAALPVANGGTNVTSASGTALDNITGFSGTGVINRTGAGTYSFVPVGTTGNSTIVQTNSSGLIANSLISGLPVANLGGAINGDVIYGSGGIWTVTSLATLLSTATPGFNTLTSGTNAGAAMVVGTGASLAASGTGTITATGMPAGGLTGASLPSNITGSFLTSVGTIGTGTWQGAIVGVTYGGTGANLSTTGGASQVLQQTTTGGNVTVGQLAASNLSNGTNGSGAIVLASSPSLTTPNLGAATASSLTDSGITAGQCVQSGTGGLLQGTGQACPTATPAFSAIAAGTNTNALVIGSGGSLGTSGTGTITATAMPALGLTGTALPALIVGSSLTSVGTLGTLTVGGAVTFSGLGAGTQTSCLGLTSGNVVVPSAGACGTGGGGGGITAVNGTAGQINASTASGVVTLSLPTTITQSETFSALAGTIFSSQLQSSPTSTIASAAGATLDDVIVTAQTTTVTGTTGITTAKGFNKVSIYQPTFSDSSAVTISNAATLYVDAAPLAGGSVTINSPYAIRVGSGNVSFPGTGNILGTITSGTWNGNQIGLAYGGTGANLSATGGTNQVLQQATVGGAVTVGQLAASNLSNGTTGSGAVVLATSPTLTTPNLGTPSTAVLTNATGLPLAGLGGAVNNDCVLGVSGAWAASALCDLTNLAATYTAPKSFTNNDLILLGATSGSTILQAPATGGGTIVLPATAGTLLESAGNNTLGGTYTLTGTFQNATGNAQTFPSSTAALAGTNVAQTWSAVQSFNSGNLVLNGSTSGTLTVKPAAVAGTNTLTLPAGSTDFSATGGTSQVVKQTSAGGAFTVAQLAASDLSNNTTGSGAVVLATSPTLTTPNLGTPSTLTLTNATGLPLAGLAGQVNNNCALGNGTNWVASPLCDLTNQTATISAVKTYTAAPVISSITNTGTLTLPTTTGTLLESAGNNTLGGTYNLTGTLAVTIGSDATGDTYYRNASGNLTRLGIGANGTFYSVVSGIPSWVTAPTGTTTITLGAGLANAAATYNPGTQTVTNGSTIYQQLLYKAVSSSCTTDSTCGSTNDGGYLLTPTAASLTITLTANGVRQYGYDGSHAYTLSAPSNSIYGCGPTGGSVVVATQVEIVPDGTNYQCVPSAQPVPVTASWLPGQNLVISGTNVGVGLYTANSNKTVLAIVCTPEKAVGAGSDTLDVYLAASGTALQSGTKLTTTSCNVNGTAATNSGALLSAPVALPAGSRIGIIATGADWASSAGSGSITVTVE